MSSHEYARARRRAPSASSSLRGSSARRLTIAFARARGSSGGTSTPVSGVITSRYPGMSDATTGVALGHRDAVRDHLVLAGQIPTHSGGRFRRDRDPIVEPLGEEAEDRSRELHPGELARGVEGGDERYPRERERGDADRRRHGLVNV